MRKCVGEGKYNYPWMRTEAVANLDRELDVEGVIQSHEFCTMVWGVITRSRDKLEIQDRVCQRIYPSQLE